MKWVLLAVVITLSFVLLIVEAVRGPGGTL